MCLHPLEGGPVGLSQGSVMSPISKRAVWQQDDCSCWPVQNFFHGILWDLTSRMVMICWFWMILTHTGHRWVQRSGVPMVDSWPVGLSHVCTYVYAHMCHVWAPEDGGSNSSHPLSCDSPSTGTQDSYPPPLPVICQDHVVLWAWLPLSSSQVFNSIVPQYQQALQTMSSQSGLDQCGDIELSWLDLMLCSTGTRHTTWIRPFFSFHSWV